MDEENKNKNNEEEKQGLGKPYRLLMNHVPEDKRKSKKFLTKGRLYIFLFVAIIIIVNLPVIYVLFSGGFPAFDSALSKVFSQVNIVSHDILAKWDNIWYLGFPLYYLNNVLLTYLFSGIRLLFGLSAFIFAAKFLMAILYLFVPVSLYFFVRYVSKKEFTALVSVLIFSAPPFLFFWLPAVRDMFVHYGYIPWGVYLAKVDNSYISHLFSFCLVPLAGIFFLKTLKDFRFKYFVMTAVLFALACYNYSYAVPMTVLLVFVLALSEAILGHPGEKIRRTFLLWLVVAGLIAAKYNIPYLVNSYTNSDFGAILKNIVSLLPLAFVVLPILGTILFLVFDRKPKFQILFISIVMSLFLVSAVASWSFGQKAYVPSPNFLYMEMHISVSILLAYLVTLLVMLFKKYALSRFNPERASVAVSGLIIIVICLAVGLINWNYKKSHDYLKWQSQDDWENSDIYQVSQWLKDKAAENERVYATGELSAWFNYFTLTPQVKGQADLSVVNDLWRRGSAEIEKGSDIAQTENYLRILGVRYLVVRNPDEGQTDRQAWDYFYPEKFKEAKILEREMRIGAYDIYKVSLNSLSMAQVIDDLAYQDLQTEDYEENLNDYADMLDSGNSAVDYMKTDDSQIFIEAQLTKNQALVIKENYHKIWQARINNEKISVAADSLGYIYIRPNKEGLVKIEFSARREVGQYIGYAISILTIIFLFVFRTKKVKKVVTNFQALPEPKGLLASKPAREASFVDMMTNHEDELARVGAQAKEHYEINEDADWVEGSDNFARLSVYFHRNREILTQKLIKKFGFGSKYLDAGCGTGLLLQHLPQGSIGLDINPQNIARAKKNVPEAALVVADIENIPFPSNMFDTVVCAEVLDRLPNPKLAVKEILRILKPGGVLIGTVPRENPLWRLRFLSSVYSPEPYRFEYSRQEIENLLGSFEKLLVSPALSYMTWAFVVKKKEGIM
ncbi:MAG: methyltransferase domain-containing protein [Patescibacteria group bacterium]